MTLSVREHVADDSRADILRAAAMCFMERGYDATSIDDVARRLGATKGRIYHYYPSKADLFADVYRTGMDMNYEAIGGLISLSLPTVEKWRRMATAHTYQMIRARPFQRAVWEGVELTLRGSTTPAQREVLGELLDYRHRYGVLFRDVIEKAQQEGTMNFPNLSIANQLMLMTLNSPIFWYKPRANETDADLAEIVAQVVECALRGLGHFEGAKA